MAEYLITDAEAVASADAIRAKTGSTAKIEWKTGTGFAHAVEEIATPSGTKEITENGVYDVTNYAAVEVEVAGSGSGGNSQIGVALSTAGFIGGSASEYLGG